MKKELWELLYSDDFGILAVTKEQKSGGMAGSIREEWSPMEMQLNEESSHAHEDMLYPTRREGD